jgi:hypothetical protein
MDGGRVLRALLAHALGRLRATEIAARLGVFMAALFAIVGLVFGQWTLFLVGIFVFFAGQQELAAVRFRPIGQQDNYGEDSHSPGDVIFDRLPDTDPHYSGFTWDGRARTWVKWEKGQPIQTIPLE